MSKAILDHILDGSILIDSLDAFESVVQEFPEHPELLKLVADSLAAKGKRQSAAQNYKKASAIFLGSGRLLHAVVVKMLEWRLDRPARESVLGFLSAVRVQPHEGGPVNRFLQSLLPAEQIALFSQFSCNRFPSGKTIRNIGEPETHLWLVLAGKLKETHYQLIGHKPKFNKQRLQQGAIRLLGPNDVFGDIFPFTETSTSQGAIDAVSGAEVIAIPRSRLIKICQKYPKVELGILKLLQVRSEKGADSHSSMVRSGERYAMHVNMSVTITPAGITGPPLTLNGVALDLSVSGVSFIPENSGSCPPAKLASLVKDHDRQRVRVAISSETLSMSISGQIVRMRELMLNGSRTISYGIKFDAVSPRLRGAFFAFAESTGNFDKSRKTRA